MKHKKDWTTTEDEETLGNPVHLIPFTFELIRIFLLSSTFVLVLKKLWRNLKLLMKVHTKLVYPHFNYL